MISPRSQLCLAIGLTMLLALSAIRVASAHARLLRSNPEDGAVLEAAPREVFMWFDEVVATEFSSLNVLTADGQLVGSAVLRSDPSDPTLVIAALPELAEGVIVLSWKVFSNIDSHETQGTLVFGIGQAFDASAQPASRMEPAPPALEVALRALNYVALVGLVGSLLVAGLILRPGRYEVLLSDTVKSAQARVLRLALGATIMAFLIGLGWLAWQTSAIGRSLLDSLLETRFGLLWLMRQGALVAAYAACVAVRRRHRWGWWVSGVAVVAVAVSQALNSHAAGLAERSALAVASDTLHLLAAGGWVGSMLALLAGLLPLVRSRRLEAVQVALGGWQRFGALAAISVGTLAATGLYSAARQVASIDAWISTTYGQVLSGKIGLFLLAGLIGATNSLLLHPRLAAPLAAVLRRPAGWTPVSLRRLPVLLIAEAGMVLAVLAASSVLTATPPARGPEFDPPRELARRPSSLSQPVDDLLVALTIRPNKPGPNLIQVDALNTRRPPPAPILRVLVRLQHGAQDLGRQTLVAELQEGNAYRVNTSALSLAGAWRIQVVVRRQGIEDSVAEFDWQVESLAPSLPPRPVVVSNIPLEPSLTLLAAGLAACMGILAIIGMRTRRARMSQRSDHRTMPLASLWTEIRSAE